MNLSAIEAQINAQHLTVLGGFHPTTEDAVAEGCKTLLLLGPDEPEFWPAFTKSPEYLDQAPHPMDRWSTRVIGDLAKALGAQALFPFGGAPYHPFYSWALRTGRIHASPINFLVHDRAGLFVSFRGALCLPDRHPLPQAPAHPCKSCPDQPCTSACPVDALNANTYDVQACKAYLGTSNGSECMTQGCAVRRSCPVSQRFARQPAQSAFHMRAFKGD